jgi:hypothetical protein
MTEEHDLGAGLIARTAPYSPTHPARLDIVFPGGGSGLRFERAPHHTRACLAYGGWLAVPDVSAQPGAIVRQLHLSAREHAVDPNRWQHLVLSALRTWHGSLDWCQHLLAGIGAITHPLLGPVYERGHAPSAELPRWGTDVLRQHTAADAARTLCSEPNRRLTRSLAASLTCRPPHEPIDFTPLGWAVAAADLVDPDILATLLDTHREQPAPAAPLPTGTGTGLAGNAEPDAPTAMPSVDDVATVRRGIRHWPRDRRSALLLDAARNHGMSDFVTALTHLIWVRDRIDQALPVRVDDLRALCRRHVPVLAPAGAATATHDSASTGTGTAAPAARRPRRATPPEPTAGVLDLPHTPTDAPAATRPRRRSLLPSQPLGAPRHHPLSITAGTPLLDVRWTIPEPLLGLHRHHRNGITFEIATSAFELRTWGQQLRNCLGSFAAAAHSGSSWLIGLSRDEVLIGCVEVHPQQRRVVQATGVANRALPLWVQRTIIDVLHQLQVTRQH